MKGDGCVSLAMDRRMGAQFKQIAMDFTRVYKMTDKTLAGFVGLAGDIQTFSAEMKYCANMYELRENRQMEPRVFTSLLTKSLYKKRTSPYFIEPIVAGLDKDN